MIVLVGGMPRSGSTFSFNIVRELLECRGVLSQKTAPGILPAIEGTDADHFILKSHFVDDPTVQLVRLGAIKAICTIRKPEDAAASWMESFGFSLEQTICDLRQWFAVFTKVRKHCLVVSYEEIERDSASAAHSIARYIVPDVPSEEVFAIAARHSRQTVLEHTRELSRDTPGIEDIGFSYHDAATFCHRRHVSESPRSAAERIGEQAVRSIRMALGDIVDGNGDVSEW